VNDLPVTPLVRSLPSSVPFVGPETLERRRGAPFQARLGANENGFGPAPSVAAAIAGAATQSWRYCDPENYELKQALAANLGVSPENVVVGEGIDGLFGYTVRMFVEPGVAVATSQGAYPTFNFHVAGYGGRLVTVPFTNDREDPQALADLARRERARLVFLANPDNPMGSWWPAAAVTELINDLPGGAILCLDEAYGEFAPEGTLPPLHVSDPRVIRFRTFSKAYGLAGLRVAYAIGEKETIKSFDKVRNHFGVNKLAQIAALAALADQDYLRDVVAKVKAARDRIAMIARDNDLKPLPSATNFVTIDCGQDGAFARRVLEELAKRDIFVRMPGVSPLDRCIRISAGPDFELGYLARVFPDALKAASA
jgi:histidinol-phosphate aminotransferase